MPARENSENSGGLSSCSSIVVREMKNPGGGFRGGGEVTEIAFSADSAHLLTGAKNFAVRVWDIRSGDVEMYAPPLVSTLACISIPTTFDPSYGRSLLREKMEDVLLCVCFIRAVFFLLVGKNSPSQY